VNERVYTVLFPFGGIGGGAIGMKKSGARLFGINGRFRVIGGIDFDAAACDDFESLVGAPSLCADIAHLKPHELRQLSPECPDVVFLSPPCKGASGLLSAELSKTPKYQAMNRLALNWIELMLETWDTRPRFVLIENVPRLKQRAAGMLKRIRQHLRAAGYVFHDGFHDCGELGGLAQVRRRYLLVARHAASTPPLLYQPPKKRVRGCGEVLGLLPMPGDAAAGPMHRLPRLSWLNWVRLSLIPAGGDWRDLEGVLKDGQPRREVFRRHKVQRWGEPADTVAGSGSNAPSNVADPRVGASLGQHHNKMRVEAWDKPAHVVTGSDRVGSGAPSVADPRSFGHTNRVTPWDGPIGTVTASPAPSSGGGAVADPRALIPDAGAYDHGYGVLHWKEPSSTVAAGSQVGQGAYSVADLRIDGARRDAWGVLDWREPSGTVTGNGRIATGPFSAADPRFNCEMRTGAYGVLTWREAAATITGSACHDNGPFTISDPRKPPPFTPYIIAADGTWHRPLTTLELAALQSCPTMSDGKPLVLSGKSHSSWRERIGNMVPPDAAEAIGAQILVALLQADCEGFALSSSSTPVWVRPELAEVRA
jgi:site-specific DNA-cytosine methylase